MATKTVHGALKRFIVDSGKKKKRFSSQWKKVYCQFLEVILPSGPSSPMINRVTKKSTDPAPKNVNSHVERNGEEKKKKSRLRVNDAMWQPVYIYKSTIFL